MSFFLLYYDLESSLQIVATRSGDFRTNKVQGLIVKYRVNQLRFEPYLAETQTR